MAPFPDLGGGDVSEQIKPETKTGDDSPRKQQGGVVSMAAEMEGIEGSTGAPQGIDRGWRRTRHFFLFSDHGEDVSRRV